MDFKLRPFVPSDNLVFAKNANNPKVANQLTNQFPNPYTLEHANNFIEMAMSQTPTRIFAIEINGEAIGGIGLHEQKDVYEKNTEMGYWVEEHFWGNGIATKAIKEIVEYGFKTFDITRFFARPFGDNLASQRVLEKAGFTLEATIKNSFYKHGKFKDELIYAIRNG